jgi:hypothetical protein
MAFKGHRRKTRTTRRKRWSKRVRGGCRYGKLKHPRGRRICRRRPK